MSGVESQSQILSLTRRKPAVDAAEFWQQLRERARDAGAARTLGTATAVGASALEAGLSVISTLKDAPPRTLHSVSILRSSPMPMAVRAMIERREFGRRYDALQMDLDALQDRLPPLTCPQGEVEFLADDRSFEDLSRSVDGLLQNRKARSFSLFENSKILSIARYYGETGPGPEGTVMTIRTAFRDTAG